MQQIIAKHPPASPQWELPCLHASAVNQARQPVKTKCSYWMADFDKLPDSAFVRLPSLLTLFACSRATIWRRVKEKKLPAPKKLGPRLSAWNVGEIRLAISVYMKGEMA